MTRIITLLVFFLIALVTYLVISYSMEYPELTPIKDMDTENVQTSINLDWVDYSAPNGRFSASFPLMPQNATKSVTDPETGETRDYDMYASEKADQTIFIVSLITFPDLSPNLSAEELLQAVPSDIISKHPDSRINSMQMGTYEGFPSLDFSIASEKIIYDTKAFMVGNTLFVLSRIAKTGNQDNSEYQKFIDSFQLNREGVNQ